MSKKLKESAVEAAPVAITKPKAAKKSAAANALEVAPAKKAAVKKTAVKTAANKAVAAVKPVEPSAKAPAKKAAPKAGKTAVKKAVKKSDKGRDLVTEEPGAAEVAEVLGEDASEPAADDESAPIPKLESKGPESEASESEEPEATASEANQPDSAKPEPKLERLQKILAKAGISSRRKSEELILGGQVQINGKVVTELGTKADPERDHIRVDGKLLQGPERIRYFVLNKPKGYVTTVSDPEGRPTVMQFFASERERLYPVGRLDYLSEGLLLVTNDGELANKLTKAASGVEKTYLVKVAGQPTEDMLDVLRGGVIIEKGRPGEHTGRVRTAPARIRQVRQGDNPWYEVIIIEGRNRELRKMFEEIGHHVEKIRRVGYGPLVLDLEPGKLRELEAEEVQQLRLAADGKLKKKSKRSAAAGQLPTVAGKTVRYKKADGKPGYEPRIRPEFQVESKAESKPGIKTLPKTAFKPRFDFAASKDAKPGFKKSFKPAGESESKPRGEFKSRPDSKPAFNTRPDSRPAFKSRSDARPDSRPDARPDARPDSRPNARPGFQSASKPGFAKPAFRSDSKPGFKPGFKSAATRPSFGGQSRSNRPAELPVTDIVLPPRKAGAIEADSDFDSRPEPRNSGSKPAFRSDRPGSKPAFRSDSRSERPFKSDAPRGPGTQPLGRYNAADDDYVPKKTPGFRIEQVEDKPRSERDSGRDSGRPVRSAAPRSSGFARTGASARPASSRPASGRPESGRPASGRPSGRPAGDRPYRPRADSPSMREGKTFEGASDAPRESRPRPSFDAPRSSGTPKPAGDRPFGGPKKFGGAKPFGAKPSGSRTDGPKSFGKPRFETARPAPGGRNSVPSNKLGPDGQPRIKERHRNSFTGKNKGRPKPKAE